MLRRRSLLVRPLSMLAGLRRASPGLASAATGGAVWLGACFLFLASSDLHNDDFDRVSRGRQIARYGEVPFRDFFDPGFLGAEISSAGAQLVFGDALVGELVLTTTFTASGLLLVFLLARRVSTSVVPALAVVLLTLLALPRPYDYDKVFFYPLGLLLCWRYAERPTLGRVAALAAGVAAGGIFRYDTGLYIAAAGVVVIAVVQAGSWRRFARQAGLLALAGAVLASPVVAYVSATAGPAVAVDQIVTYAVREGARTRLPPPDRPSPRAVAAALAGLEPAEGSASKTAIASMLLHDSTRLLPAAVAIVLLVEVGIRRRITRPEAARAGCLLVFCGLLGEFILRAPLCARFGGMAGPLFVLLLWGGRWLWRATPPRPAARVPAALCLLIVAWIPVWSVWQLGEWSRFPWIELTGMARVRTMIADRAAMPPRLDIAPISPEAGLVQYLRDCTGPDDYVYASWYTPALYFFAQRGFAAGMTVTFGGHWSEPRFETRALDLLASQQVPIAVLHDPDGLEAERPGLAAYLDRAYVVAGQADFGDADVPPGGYWILVRRDMTPVRRHPASLMPCFA